MFDRVPHQAQPHEEAADGNPERDGGEDDHEERRSRPRPDEELDRGRLRVLRAEHGEDYRGDDGGGDDQPGQVGDVRRDGLLAAGGRGR